MFGLGHCLTNNMLDYKYSLHTRKDTEDCCNTDNSHLHFNTLSHKTSIISWCAFQYPSSTHASQSWKLRFWTAICYQSVKIFNALRMSIWQPVFYSFLLHTSYWVTCRNPANEPWHRTEFLLPQRQTNNLSTTPLVHSKSHITHITSSYKMDHISERRLTAKLKCYDFENESTTLPQTRMINLAAATTRSVTKSSSWWRLCRSATDKYRPSINQLTPC